MLSNNEHIPFGFNFDRATYETPGGDGKRPVLQFEPSSGTVPPNSSIPVVVTFVPDVEKTLNYNVVAAVRKKPSRLTLNVKAGWCKFLKRFTTVPTTVPANFPATVPATVPANIPATFSATVSATVPATVPQG